jgi:hypothetical protein
MEESATPELTCSDQVITRDHVRDWIELWNGEKRNLSYAYRVYNNNNDLLVLPIAYIIQVWPKPTVREFIPAY